MKYRLVCLLTLIFACPLFADAKFYYYQRHLQSNILDEPQNGRIQSLTFAQKINHNDPHDTATFDQRYYLDLTYATSLNSPILLYICGEGTCKSSSLLGQVSEWARKWNAILVSLEHRYYGISQPFEDLSTEHLRFLTVDQALQDLYAFQKYLTNVKNYSGKWVAVGGSYPGNLAAAYRLKYPDMVVGALASSAPVMAKENFEEYDAHVTKVAGPHCVSKIREVVSVAEQALTDPVKLASLKKQFEAQAIIDNKDFLYLIADISAVAVQYGYRDKFCNMIDSDNPTKGYAEFARYIYRTWNIDAVSFTFQKGESLDPDDYLNFFGMRQWLYQSCTEYGYWQNAHQDKELSSRSSVIDLDYHRQTCKRLFGLDTPANVQSTNKTYYFPLFESTTSNIFFTNGSRDPWSMLSLSEETIGLNPNIDLYVIEGAAHCDDLRPSHSSDSPELKTARQLFQTYAGQWLD